jgi:DNA adenine methylase
MGNSISPLRYPGGKSQLTPLVIELLRRNDLFYGHYVEPCAGGAGIAWRLLLEDYVAEVHINDLDPAIYSFWYCVLNETEALCERIDRVKVTMAQWYRQRKVQADRSASKLDLGFSTFFLNRTNRSGIINGGVIGGYDQEGDYPIDCRFDKEKLIPKIQRIAARADRVTLHRRDAAVFLQTVVAHLPARTLVNLDPPYYVKGPELYRNHYTPKHHAKLAAAVDGIGQQRWMVTYDDTPQTRQLYEHYPLYQLSLTYYAQLKRKGAEILALDPRLSAPEGLTPIQAQRTRLAA